MKKTIIAALALALVAGFAANAMAQDSVMWFDVRNNSADFGTVKVNQWITGAAPKGPYLNGQDVGDPALNAGGRGDAQILRVSPTFTASGWHLNGGLDLNAFGDWDRDGNYSTSALYLYMDVNGPFGSGDVISSIGFDIDSVRRSTLLANSYTASWAWEAGPWSAANAGFVNGAAAAGPNGEPAWAGAKAVKVPVEGTPPAFAVGAGLVPAAAPYRLGKLSVTGLVRSCAPATNFTNKSTYDLHLVVNNLLITRAFETGGDGMEEVAFGYTGGAPEAPYISGNAEGEPDQGVTPTAADAVISVQMRSDYNANGRMQANDLAAYLAAAPKGLLITQNEAYAFDYNGNGQLQANDLADYLASVSAAVTCP